MFNPRATVVFESFSQSLIFQSLFIGSDTVASGISRKKWSMEEIRVVSKGFHKYIIGSTLPGKTNCLKLIAENKFLCGQS